jgi:hypothetical protein
VVRGYGAVKCIRSTGLSKPTIKLSTEGSPVLNLTVKILNFPTKLSTEGSPVLNFTAKILNFATKLSTEGSPVLNIMAKILNFATKILNFTAKLSRKMK